MEGTRGAGSLKASRVSLRTTLTTSTTSPALWIQGFFSRGMHREHEEGRPVATLEMHGMFRDGPTLPSSAASEGLQRPARLHA